MKIQLKRLNKAVHFEAVNASGNSVHFDGSPEIGGEDKGVRPMEGVLMSLAGCTAIDVVDMLKKMRQELADLEIEVSAERREEVPRIFTKIHLKYILSGEIEANKALRATQMSAEKYCSVSKMLEPLVEIEHSVVLNGEAI